MSEDKPLSKRQKNILSYISEYIQDNRRPPTIREIGGAVNISSTSVVNYNLNKLNEKGFLDRDPEVSRGLRLTRKARQEFGLALNAAADAVAGQLVRIPLLGNIVAGQPIEVGNSDFSTYDEEDAIELSSTMLTGQPGELFALRVSGDSMIDAMVNDGDMVIMRRQQEVPRNGDMVAVWLTNSGTTTLKHFHHEGHRIRLQPANPTMEPIYVDPEEVQVQGKVEMVVRQHP